MPATSKAQFNLFKGICEGSIPKDRWPEGMTREKACEYVKDQSPKGLPAKAAEGATVVSTSQLLSRGFEEGEE